MKSKQEFAAGALELTGLGSLVRMVNPLHGVTVLGYHRIGDPNGSDLDKNLFSATPEELDAQLRFLERNFYVIGPHQIGDALKDKGGRGHFVLTFDDGYRDNYELALPILREHKVPTTFFLTTGFIGNPKLAWWDQIARLVNGTPKNTLSVDGRFNFELEINPNDRQQAINVLVDRYKRLPSGEMTEYMTALAQATDHKTTPSSDPDLWMTWDMVRELRDAGMSIGGHTVTHPILSKLRREEQVAEIVGCKNRLSEELGIKMKYFAYPVGSRDSFTPETQRILQEQGVEYAFSFHGGMIKPGEPFNPYAFPRESVDRWRGINHFKEMFTLPRIFH